MTTDALLRAAAHRLDGDVDLYAAHEHFRLVEQAYADRTSTDDGAAALTAAAAAVEAHARGEAAARADDDSARAHLAHAHRLGLPGSDRSSPGPSWDTTDLDTVADAAAAGDRAAVANLLTRLRPLVTRYCRERMERVPAGVRAPQVDTHDVIHEALMTILVSLPERAGRPVTWFAMGIVRRTVRIRSRHNPMPADFEEALRELPAAFRNVLMARIVLGRSAEETADLLGMTPGAVRVAQHRALIRLRHRLAE